jgi:hypothetical protein
MEAEMSPHQTFVGEHAEYYRRSVLREATRPDAIIRENEYLQRRVMELEEELNRCDEEVEYLNSMLSRRSIFHRFLELLGLGVY